MFDPLMFELQLKKKVTAMDDFTPKRYEFRMSSAGDCPKLLDYMMQEGGRPGADYQHAIRMLTGTYLHDMWQRIMAEALGTDFINAEKEVVIRLGHGLNIPGHPDGEIGSLDAVYELKTVGDSTFKLVTNNGGPLPSHHKQGNLYAHATKRKNILFHYFNRSSGESAWFMVPYSNDMAMDTLRMFETRQINAENNTIEDRPYHDPTASPCWFCHKKDTCYKDFKAEVDSGVSFKYDPDSELTKTAVLANDNRTVRLIADKAEKAAKQILTSEMIRQGVNHAFMQTGKEKDINVKITVGKNNNPLISIKEMK